MSWIKEDELVAALDADAPLTKEIIDGLETAIEIDGHDCEEWSARVGYAIVARLRRNELPAAKSPPAAPDVYAALAELMEEGGASMPEAEHEAMMTRAKAALAKARGETA